MRGRPQIDTPQQPTYALIDLDPGTDTSWKDLLVLARLHRTALEHLGVRRAAEGHRPPRHPDLDPDRARARASTRRARGSSSCRRSVGAVVPELVSWKWQVRERGGLARLDYTQNAINKTLVAPYSPRPAAGRAVSAPIDWDELDDPTLRPDRFTIRTVLSRIAERGDLFADVLRGGQQLRPLQ